MAKQFSDREKALIRSIYNAKDSNNYVLANVFQRWIDAPGIRFDLTNGQLVYDYERYKDSDSILNIKKEIISVALLVKYLEDNGYIYIIQDETSGEQPPYIGAAKMSTPLVVPIPQDIAQIIRRTLYTIYVSYSLIFFVENGFKTYEDLQLEGAKKAQCISVIMMILTFISLTLNIYFYVDDSKSEERLCDDIINTLGAFQMNNAAVFNKNALELSAHIDSLGISFTQKNNTTNINNKIKTTKRPIKRQYNLIQIDTINCDGKQYIVLPIKK